MYEKGKNTYYIFINILEDLFTSELIQGRNIFGGDGFKYCLKISRDEG